MKDVMINPPAYTSEISNNSATNVLGNSDHYMYKVFSKASMLITLVTSFMFALSTSSPVPLSTQEKNILKDNFLLCAKFPEICNRIEMTTSLSHYMIATVCSTWHLI